MTKNRLSDLNDHIYEQLERLGDENLTPEQTQSSNAPTPLPASPNK